jgi:hypothetical protein
MSTRDEKTEATLETPPGPGSAATSEEVSKTECGLAAYLKCIDRARLFVAGAFILSGLAYVVCARQSEFSTAISRSDSGIWIWSERVFGGCVYACAVAALALVVEPLARPTTRTSFTIQAVLLRALLIVFACLAVFLPMFHQYGSSQAIGAVTGVLLLLASAGQRRIKRAVLGVLAACLFGAIVISTQSPYQCARRHSDDILDAASRLAALYSEGRVGNEVDVDDPCVPKVIRELGATRVWVDDVRVSLYVPHSVRHRDYEFIVCHIPRSTVPRPVWIRRPSNKDEECRIAEGLWMTDY